MSPAQFLHLACFCGQVLLQCFGAPFFFFLPLFAQRLRAIIGPNTLHYSYLCSVHTRSRTKDIQVCEEDNSYVHSCTEARRLATANTIASPSLWLDAVSCVILSGAPRPLTAGSMSERWDPADRVLENKSVSLSFPLPLSDFLQIKSNFPNKKKKKSAAPCCEQTLQLHFQSDNGSESWNTQASSHTKAPFHKLEPGHIYNCHSSKRSQIVVDN